MIDPLLDHMAGGTTDLPQLGGVYFVRNEKYGKAVRDMLQPAPRMDRMHDAQMLLWMDEGRTQSQRYE